MMTLNVEKIRENFPHLNDIIYLGAAGSAPFSLINYNAVMECWNRRRYANTLGGIDHAWFSEKETLAKREAAKLINAEVDEICHISRVVQGLNIVRDIIDYNSTWRREDNVVMTDQGYPSTGHTFLSPRKKGVTLHVIKNVDGRIMRDDLEKTVDDHTKLVIINRTSVGSGFTYNVKEVCEIAHEKGALVVDDAIQTLGARKIDVHRDNVDFLISGSYKWQCGPPEAGIFYARKDLCETLDPAFWSYINVDKGPNVRGMDRFPFGAEDHDSIKSYDYPFYKTAQRFDMGTTATDQLWAWYATLKWLNSLGIEKISNRVYELGGYLMYGLENIGCQVKTPREQEPDAINTQRHGLIMYTTGSFDNDTKSVEAMSTRKLRAIKGPTMKYQAGYGGIRVSPHIYNTIEEIDSFVRFQQNLKKKL